MAAAAMSSAARHVHKHAAVSSKKARPCRRGVSVVTRAEQNLTPPAPAPPPQVFNAASIKVRVV